MNDMTIGQFLSAMRKSKGYTQQNVADALNVSNKTVSGWERDVATPDANFIPMLAELYGVSCDEILKGRRASPVPYGLRTDETASRLFVSTYGAQKTANAVVGTVIACLFLAGGYLTAILLTVTGGSDHGLYYALSLPFTAVSLAITLIVYFTTDQGLKLNGKDFVGLRRKLLDVTRGSLLAEIASPILLFPVLFGSENALTSFLVFLGSAFLTAVILFLTDVAIRYFNKDLFPRTKYLKACLTACSVTAALALCAVAVCLHILYEVKYSSVDVLTAETEFDSYDDMQKALGYDPIMEQAKIRILSENADGNAECTYVFPKDSDVSELLRAYPEYSVYRLPDRLEVRMTYRLLTVNATEVVDGNETTISKRILLTAPDKLNVSYVKQSGDKYVAVSPLDAAAARKRMHAANDFAAAVTMCASGLISVVALFTTTRICRRKMTD